MTAMDITIHASFLRHDDPDASLAFYRDTLGFEVRKDVGYGGSAGSRSALPTSPARPSSWSRRPQTPASPTTSAAPSSR
jgi:catechol 2,3-dioxygenase-like lactoylglutathione lyase family enzyme